jgi:hypothetical protein
MPELPAAHSNLLHARLCGKKRISSQASQACTCLYTVAASSASASTVSLVLPVSPSSHVCHVASTLLAVCNSTLAIAHTMLSLPWSSVCIASSIDLGPMIGPPRDFQLGFARKKPCLIDSGVGHRWFGTIGRLAKEEGGMSCRATSKEAVLEEAEARGKSNNRKKAEEFVLSQVIIHPKSKISVTALTKILL